MTRRSASPEQAHHVRTEFNFTVSAPYELAAPLFGPQAERAWATDDWNPQFLYPETSVPETRMPETRMPETRAPATRAPEPERDIEGAVFQVTRGRHTTTWVNTAFDLVHGHIQYVYFQPETMATRIIIRLTRSGPETTGVWVTYERTALQATANRRIRRLGKQDQGNGAQWKAEIERYLFARLGIPNSLGRGSKRGP